MRSIVVAFLGATLSGCIAHVDQGKLEPVTSGERVSIAAPLTAIENRGLVKLEWQLLPGMYVERYSSALGRVFVSEGRLVQSTTTLGEKSLHAGGFIMLKDTPEMGKLYIVRGTSGHLVIPLDPLSGRHGSLTLITDFPLSAIKRR